MPKLRVLSAGAPKTGVRLCTEAYSRTANQPFVIEFATAPKIKDLVVLGGDYADVVVAPRASIQTFVANGAVVDGSVVPLGSVSTGIAVTVGAQEPDISTVSALQAALRSADKLVFNTASSGEHTSNVIERLGLTEATKNKVVRTHSGAEVLQHIAADDASGAIGFGQITEIRLHEYLGVRLVGPLPGEFGKTTYYDAALLSAGSRTTHAQSLLAFFSSVEGKAILTDAGLTQENHL